MNSGFAFDAGRHEYTNVTTGEVVPHITGMLNIDARWFTEASRVRGSAVHKLTYDLDMGLLEGTHNAGIYNGWFQAYVDAVRIIKPQWSWVETPYVHPVYQFGGTLDRAGAWAMRRFGIVDLKTGDGEDWHSLQTALQAHLIEPIVKIRARDIPRYSLYLRETGRWKLEAHPRKADIDDARDIIRTHCGR